MMQMMQQKGNPQMMQMMQQKGAMQAQMMGGGKPGMPMGMPMNPMMGKGGMPPQMGGMPQQPQQQGGPPGGGGGGQQNINASALAAAPPAVQKQMIGEKLYPAIAKYNSSMAGKVTGMMLEMDNSELLMLLESEHQLKQKVDEAMLVLGGK